MPLSCTKEEFTLPVFKIDNPGKGTYSIARQYAKAIILTPPGESKPRILNFTSIGYEIHPNEHWVNAIESVFTELDIQTLSAFFHIDWGRYCARWTCQSTHDIQNINLSPAFQVLSSYNDLIAFRLVGGFYDAKFKTHIFLDAGRTIKHIKKDKNSSFKQSNVVATKLILENWNEHTLEQIIPLIQPFDISLLEDVLAPLRLIAKKTYPQIQSLWSSFNCSTKYDFLAIVSHLVESSTNEMGFEVRCKIVSDLNHKLITT